MIVFKPDSAEVVYRQQMKFPIESGMFYPKVNGDDVDTEEEEESDWLKNSDFYVISTDMVRKKHRHDCITCDELLLQFHDYIFDVRILCSEKNLVFTA